MLFEKENIPIYPAIAVLFIFAVWIRPALSSGDLNAVTLPSLVALAIPVGYLYVRHLLTVRR